MNGWKGRRWLGWLRILLLALAAGPALAAPTVIDFEDLLDGDVVAAQYADLAFANATAITAGLSLNEFDFPPHSGVSVVTGSDVAFGGTGSLVIEFIQPVTAVWAFFTHEAQLTLSAFDPSGKLLGTAMSGSGSNLLLSGSGNPNERVDFSGLGDIAELRVASPEVFDFDLDAYRFAYYTLDDLTFERAEPGTVPEPSTLLLVVAGVVGLGRRRVVAAG